MELIKYKPSSNELQGKKNKNYLTPKVVAMHMSKTCPAHGRAAVCSYGAWGHAPTRKFVFTTLFSRHL